MSHSDATLETAILAGVDGRLLDVHTQLRGNVVSYDEATKTCEVEIATKFAVSDGKGGTVYQKLANLPNVPVAWPSAGGFMLHWPLPVGASVYVSFDECDSQRWENTGSVSDPGWLERFGLSSPLAHPYSRTPIETSGACMVCPTPFEFAAPFGTAKFVAIAEKVAADTAALKAMLATMAGTLAGASVEAACATAGAALTASLASWPNPAGIAATKLKSQ